MSSTDVFFSEKNEAMLQRVLYNDICRRTGNDLSERQANRLIKTVKHYMGEIHRVKNGQPASELNKEVLRVVLPDYIMYLDRKQRDDRSVVSDIEVGPGVEGRDSDATAVATLPEDRRIQDIGTAFSKLQTARQENRSKPPVQDFRLSLNDEPALSMDAFERMKSEREAEAARTVEKQMAMTQTSLVVKSQVRVPSQGAQGQGAQGQAAFAETLDVFAKSSRRANEESETAFAEAERRRLESRANASNVFTNAPPPDMRALILGDRTNLDRRINESAGNPSLVRDSRTTSQQMLIVPEPDSIAYKESELNLFVYSGDRDWISNSSETRYNFSVNFDPSNLPVGLRLSPTATVKFRNIVRIELIKAIMPGEGLDMIVSKSGDGAYDSSVNVNILSFPYIQVRIPELETNNYGTNQGLNSAFGVLQYDGNWISDTSITSQRGYLAMIPKFMKCQKVYQPTPLATIQKLTFNFQRPDGTALSTAADTLDISQIIPTFAMTAANFTAANALTNTYYEKDAAVDTNASAYYWIQTSKYFNHWNVTKGDKIVMKNLQWGTAATGNATTQLADFLNYIQQDGGLLVVDTGVITGTAPANYVFSSGGTYSYNAQGYANAILVRGKFADPTTGVFTPVALGGIADSYTSGNISHYLTNTALTSGRLINLNHQVQIAMRVITRELDSTGILRPDNL
jgi:hypothetical protein